MSHVGILPSAGLGTRLNLDFPKELLEVNGEALIDSSIRNFVECGINTVIVIIRSSKEAIQDYLVSKYEDLDIVFCHQQPPFGNLMDAIKSAIPLIQGHHVHLALADTVLAPAPYSIYNSELTLHCFTAQNNEWRHYGCIDERKNKIIDKPLLRM